MNKKEGVHTIKTEELLNMFFKINNIQKYNIGQLSVIELFNYIIKLEDYINLNEDILKGVESEYTNILSIRDTFLNYIKKLYKVDSTKKFDIEQIKYYKIVRDNIRELSFLLSIYINEIDYYNEILLSIIRRRSNNINKNNKTDIFVLCSHLKNKYYNNPKMVETYIPEIINVIPLYLAKDKYFSLVRNGLRKSMLKKSNKFCETMISTYKYFFNGHLHPKYGIKFEKYFFYVEELKMIKFKELSYEAALNKHEEILRISDEMNNISEIIRILGLIINRFIILSMIDVEYGLSDLYNKKPYLLNILEIEKSKERDRYIQQNNKYINKLNHEIKKKNIELSKIINELISRKINNEKILNEINKTEHLLAYYKDEIIQPEEFIISEDNNNLVNKEYLELLIDNFIDYILRSISKMNKNEKKNRMKKLLSLISIPFDTIDEFVDYIKYSLEMCSDKEDLKYYIELIYTIIDK
ncbi:hypothetical protein [Abyssisolibacter fermentans]|uniref:hypothetical protein n=1 Tax=Abyssisolibacter fermentans TaxID=1766203 RepID=UPI0008364D31|nr:hypothetical protein [Abyssisolibacter fermentans]